MKKFIVFLLAFLLVATIPANAADIIIKVSSTSVNPNGLEEKVYGIDNVGVEVEGEEPLDAYKAYDVAEKYNQFISGLRYQKMWDVEVFKKPAGIITTETINSVVIMNFQNYLLKDNFEAFSIEYDIKVFNRGPVFVGNLLFYKELCWPPLKK